MNIQPQSLAWQEAKIKQLTGGDRLTARFMQKDFSEYDPVFKLLLVGNHAPSLKSVDKSIKRRMNILPFIHPTRRTSRTRGLSL